METLVMAAQKDRPHAELGAMVARYREAANVTQEGLARQIKVTTSMMSKIEQGLTKPGVANAHALDDALGTAESHLFFQAYYGRAQRDPLSMLRDDVAQLTQKVTQMSRDLDELRADVDRQRNSR